MSTSRLIRAKNAIRQLTIVVDSREQDPFDFGPDILTVRRKLDAGDYSIDGFDKEVSVERKSKIDAYSCCGGSRERFERCLERLSGLRRGAIVIECTQGAFTKPPARSAINAKQAMGSYISWSCKYRLPVYWCDNKDYAARVTLRFLMAFVKHVHGKEMN